MSRIWNKIRQSFSSQQGITSVGIADIGGNAISAIFWFYIATLLGAENYGHVSYNLAIAGVVSSISLAGANNTLYVFVAKKVKLQSTVYLMALIFGGISSIALFFIFNNIGLSILSSGYVIYSLALSSLLGSKSYRNYLKYVISQKIIMVVLAIVLYYFIDINGIILGIGISFLPYINKLYDGFREEKIDFTMIRQRIGFIMNSYLLELSVSFISSIDKLIVAPFLGFILLGNYQLAIQFYTALSIIPIIFYKIILPNESGGNSTDNLKKGAIIVSVILSALGIVLSPILLPIFFPKFTHVVTVLQIVSLAIIPNTINLTFISRYLALEKSKIALIGSGIFIFVQVVAILVLGKMIGIIGIGIALVLAETTQTVYFLSMRKLTHD